MRHYKPDAERMTQILHIRIPQYWTIALMSEPNLAHEVREFLRKKYVDKIILKGDKVKEAKRGHDF